jgi:PST family polysaccharide transporter
VGKFLGEQYLGIYIIAYNLIDMPVQRLSKNAIKVTFSTLSKFQDNLMEFKKTYKTLNYYLSLIIFPVFIGLLIVAPEFTRVFYGPQWEEMIIPLRILCLAGIFRSLLVVSSTTLFAINKPKLEVMLALFQGSIISSSAIVLLQFGISGVSIGVTTGYLIGFFVSLIVSLTIVGMKFREYVKLISNPLLGVGIIIGIWFMNLLIFKHLLTDVIFMIMNIGISMILFITYISIKDRTIFYQLRKILLTTYE